MGGSAIRLGVPCSFLDARRTKSRAAQATAPAAHYRVPISIKPPPSQHARAPRVAISERWITLDRHEGRRPFATVGENGAGRTASRPGRTTRKLSPNWSGCRSCRSGRLRPRSSATWSTPSSSTSAGTRTDMTPMARRREPGTGGARGPASGCPKPGRSLRATMSAAPRRRAAGVAARPGSCRTACGTPA